MSEEYEEYLKFLKNSNPWYLNKEESPMPQINIIGPNKKFITFKKTIGINYFSSDEQNIVYIEDFSENKQLTNDLINKKIFLHLTENILYIDFNTNYYYILIDFDSAKQFSYCQKYKNLTIALLNEDKSDIINKWTTDVNLL